MGNKNIKMNTKIRFDEEGEACGDVESSANMDEVNEDLQPVSLSEVHRAGGIDIGSTQEEMRARDAADRTRERSKVKKKHREARRKERAERKAASVGESSVTCMLPSDGEDGDDDDHGIDNLLAMVSSAEEESDERSPSPQRKKKRRNVECSNKTSNNHATGLS